MRPLLEPLSSMTRVVDARPEIVFAEWNEPARLARWWDPNSRARKTSSAAVSIREVAPLERIIFTWGGADAKTTTLVTITFAATHGGTRTRLVFEQSIAKAPCLRHVVAARWGESLDRLRHVLTTQPGAS